MPICKMNFLDFYGFPCYPRVGKAADRHVLTRMIREIIKCLETG